MSASHSTLRPIHHAIARSAAAMRSMPAISRNDAKKMLKITSGPTALTCELSVASLGQFTHCKWWGNSIIYLLSPTYYVVASLVDLFFAR